VGSYNQPFSNTTRWYTPFPTAEAGSSGSRPTRADHDHRRLAGGHSSYDVERHADNLNYGPGLALLGERVTRPTVRPCWETDGAPRAAQYRQLLQQSECDHPVDPLTPTRFGNAGRNTTRAMHLPTVLVSQGFPAVERGPQAGVARRFFQPDDKDQLSRRRIPPPAAVLSAPSGAPSPARVIQMAMKFVSRWPPCD